MTQDILQDVMAGLAAERPDAIVWACVRVTLPRVGSVEINEGEGMLISSRSERGTARLAALARRLMRGA